MRKLILASLLTLALTGSAYAGDMPQPIAPPSATVQGDMPQPIAVSGDIPYGITRATLTVLEVLLAVV